MSEVVIEYLEPGGTWMQVDESDYSSKPLHGWDAFLLRFRLIPSGNFFSIEFSTPDYNDDVNTDVQALLTAFDESGKELSHFRGPMFKGPGKHSVKVNLNFSTECLAHVTCKAYGGESGLMKCSNLNTDNTPQPQNNPVPNQPTNLNVDIES